MALMTNFELQCRPGPNFRLALPKRQQPSALGGLNVAIFKIRSGYKLFAEGFFVSPKGSGIRPQGLFLSNLRFSFPIGIWPPADLRYLKFVFCSKLYHGERPHPGKLYRVQL